MYEVIDALGSSNINACLEGNDIGFAKNGNTSLLSNFPLDTSVKLSLNDGGKDHIEPWF